MGLPLVRRFEMKRILIGAGLLLMGAVVFAQVSQQVTITVAGGIAGDVVDAYAMVFNYRPQIPNPAYCPQEEFDAGLCTPLNLTQWINNPETKNQFALRMFGEQAQENIRAVYVQYKTTQGADAAAAQAEIDSAGITVQ